MEGFPVEQHPLLFHSEATSGNTTVHWLLGRTFLLRQPKSCIFKNDWLHQKTVNTACGRGTVKNTYHKVIFQNKYPRSDSSIKFWEVEQCLSGGKKTRCNNHLMRRVKPNIDSIFVQTLLWRCQWCDSKYKRAQNKHMTEIIPIISHVRWQPPSATWTRHKALSTSRTCQHETCKYKVVLLNADGPMSPAAAGGTSVSLRRTQNKAWASRPHGSAFVSLANRNSLREMKAAWFWKIKSDVRKNNFKRDLSNFLFN